MRPAEWSTGVNGDADSHLRRVLLATGLSGTSSLEPVVSGIKTLFKTLLIKKQPWLTKQTEVSSVKVPDAGSWLLWQQPLQVVCCHLDQLLGHL